MWTNLEKGLIRGDKRINPLDEACKEHDISYSQSNDINMRHSADKVLSEKALARFKAADASFGEKTSVLGIATAMKVKRKLGMEQKKNVMQDEECHYLKLYRKLEEAL